VATGVLKSCDDLIIDGGEEGENASTEVIEIAETTTDDMNLILELQPNTKSQDQLILWYDVDVIYVCNCNQKKSEYTQKIYSAAKIIVHIRYAVPPKCIHKHSHILSPYKHT